MAVGVFAVVAVVARVVAVVIVDVVGGDRGLDIRH